MRFLLSSSPPKRKLLKSAAKSYRFGQHACDKCGCVLRLEIALDQQHRVVGARYTAKKVLPGISNKPLDRIWMTESPCTTLHEISQQTTNEMTGSYLHQIQNLLHTSPSLQKLYGSHTNCYNLLHSTLNLLCHQYLPVYSTLPTEETFFTKYYAPPILPDEQPTLDEDWVSYVDSVSEMAS